MIDVLIIGAGPIGLMMGLECVRHGLSCKIIDRGSRYLDQSRAVGVQARSLEIFHHIGVVDQFLNAGLKVKAANSFSSSQKQLSHIPFEAIPSSYPFLLTLPQDQTEQILEAHLNKHGVFVDRFLELTRIEEKEGRVEAHLSNLKTQEQTVVHAHWSVGCDGAHSCVRKQLAIPFEGKALRDIFSLAEVDLVWDHPHDEFFIFFTPHGLLAFIPLPEPQRYRMVFQRTDYDLNLKELQAGVIDEKILPLPTLNELESLLISELGPSVHIKKILWQANFKINSRKAALFRKGSIFLAGDAAHIHSPLGAQGMNTGWQDVFNLAWKLALVHRKQAAPGLLDTYEVERKKVAEHVLKGTERASFMATVRNPFLRCLRDFFISHVTKVSSIRRWLASQISQVDIRYPRNSIIGKNGGKRAPNASLIYEGKQTDLYTLWQGSVTFHVLICSGAQELKREEFESQLGSNSVQVWMLPYSQAHEVYAAYHVKKEGIIVIRPDLCIGCLYHALDLNPIVKYLEYINPTCPPILA